MSNFKPTAEQEEILRLVKLGGTVVIEAGAGTGKTASMILIGEALAPKQGQYICFNAPIAAEARTKFPKNVRCNTAHSLAYQAIGNQFSARLDSSKRIKSYEQAKVLGIQAIDIQNYNGEMKHLTPGFLAGVVMRGIDKFCQSADPVPTARHLPYIDNLDAPASSERPKSFALNNKVAEILAPVMARAWTDLQRFDGSLRFNPGHYLKMWQLSKPKIYCDFILFDEAQDASPVMLDIVTQQTHAQRVYVGDSQQQIYSFTGAINALANVDAEHTAFLTQSFRFGPAVAHVANDVLGTLRAKLRLVGYEAINSVVRSVPEPKAILCRTNASAMTEVLNTLAEGRKPFLVGKGGDIASFARAADNLMNGRRTEHAELACFENWNEVLHYVDNDEQGDELRLMVRLITEFGVQKILAGLDSMATEQAADVIISTAHKSKGREWSSVKLSGDFPDEPKNDEELRLLYVAVTRAREALDITAVGWFNLRGAASAAPATAGA